MYGFTGLQNTQQSEVLTIRGRQGARPRRKQVYIIEIWISASPPPGNPYTPGGPYATVLVFLIQQLDCLGYAKLGPSAGLQMQGRDVPSSNLRE